MTELMIYIIVGVAAGLLSGLLGIGGGVILVPSFLWMFEYQNFSHSIATHMAAATSLAAMIINTGVSFYTHWRKGVYFGNILYELIPGLMVGTLVGALLSHHLHAYLLRTMFGVLLLGVALNEYFHSEPKQIERKDNVYTVLFGGLGIGIVSGLLGVGGGSLMLPFLQRIGVTIHDAVGISTAGGLAVAIIGTISFIILGLHLKDLPPHAWGYIYLPAAIGVTIGSPLFSALGAIWSHRISVVVLKRIFSVFLVVVGIHLLHY